MGGLFSTDTSSKYMNRQMDYTRASQRAAGRTLNPKVATGPLSKLQTKLGKQGLPPVSSVSDAYSMGINKKGDVNVDRQPFTQGWLDNLWGSGTTADASYSDLLGQLSPGYGKLSEERQKALELEKRKGVGDLRAQLAKRRVLGASFATDQEASVAAEYDRLKDQARGESIVAELQQTQQVITERADTALKYTQQALQHAQFEGALQAGLMQGAQDNLMKLKDLQVDLAKMVAAITSAQQIGSAEIKGQLASQMAGSFSQYAGIESQEKAAIGDFIGSVLGTAVGFAGGGGLGGAAGLFGGSGGGYSYNSSAAGMPWQSASAASNFSSAPLK